MFMDLHGMSHCNWSVHDKVEGASVLRPNANPNGGWSQSDLTTSGQYVRGIIQEWYTCVVDPVDPPALLGDSNLDGTVNFLDIAAFIAILTDSSYLLQADCNEDGVVNFLDISVFIQILTEA